MLAEEKIACCNQGTLHAPSSAPAADHKFYVSDSWPWELHEELSQHSVRSKIAAPAAHESMSPFTSVTHHRYKQQQPIPYSLSSRAEFSATASTSRSAISSSPSATASTSPYTALSSQSYATSSPAASDRVQQFTSLWEDESADESLSGKDAADQQQLPPVDPCDYMKTLLTQLSSSISSITTAYAHQQAAVHSHNVQAAATYNGREKGRAPTKTVISATDKAMVEALENLSRIHSQLALLPRRLSFKESGAEGGRSDMEEEGEGSLQLRRYEGIIARLQDEIWRKDAVVEALKETLAKSMLKGEKLQQRVHALEAQLSKLSKK